MLPLLLLLYSWVGIRSGTARTVECREEEQRRGREEKEAQTASGGGGGGGEMKKPVASGVSVDLEGLDCTVCFEPLQTPLFQCAAGHVVCSSCYGKLPDKANCQVCYNRCFAVERILQSIQVPCSNASHGCAAMMAYHDKEEHEKSCVVDMSTVLGLDAADGSSGGLLLPPHGLLPTDSYALIMPKLSPSATISVSISGHDVEQKTCKNKTSTEAIVMKMGPCGGGCGTARDMDMSGVNRIVKIVIRHGEAVDAMSVVYERNGLPECTDRWGGNGGKHSEIYLHEDEHLTGVHGHAGHFSKWFVIRSLTFVSNLRRFGPYGKEDGVPFALPAAPGGRILGFHARSSDGLLDAVGTYVKMN